MRLSYGEQISFDDINLSIGTIRKPRLKDISRIKFEKFDFYEAFLMLTPEMFFTKLVKDENADYWHSLSNNEKSELTMYDLIVKDGGLQESYTEIFNFFFVEHVKFTRDVFLLFEEEVEDIESLDSEYLKSIIRGVIHKGTFQEVLEIIQQVCCVYKEKSHEKPKFKNKLAEKLFKRMEKANEESKKKADLNLSLPNIISSVSCNHPSVNYTNIWKYTVFQLLDTFERMQLKAIYDMNSTRVSVWGDEKKTFEASLWYKNNYDKHGSTQND